MLASACRGGRRLLLCRRYGDLARSTFAAAAEDAQLAFSEVQRRLFRMAGSTIRLPRQIPYTIAMDMLMWASRSPGAAPTR